MEEGSLGEFSKGVVRYSFSLSHSWLQGKLDIGCAINLHQETTGLLSFSTDDTFLLQRHQKWTTATCKYVWHSLSPACYFGDLFTLSVSLFLSVQLAIAKYIRLYDVNKQKFMPQFPGAGKVKIKEATDSFSSEGCVLQQCPLVMPSHGR